MTTPDRDPLPDAAEADVVEQLTPVDAAEDAADDTWRDVARVAGDRDWQANEADLIEQSIEVPDDDDFDR
jgi:hypothetical protein